MLLYCDAGSGAQSGNAEYVQPSAGELHALGNILQAHGSVLLLPGTVFGVKSAAVVRDGDADPAPPSPADPDADVSALGALLKPVENGVFHQGLENEFEAFLEQHPIDALFISDDVEAYRGILTDKTVEYILNNYQVVSVDSQGRSLWKLI